MSELEPYIGPHPTDNTLTEYYLKSEVDKVLAEKNKKISRLHKALYKACANWAIFRACIFEDFGSKLYAKKWERMLNKCRAKVEQYK